MERALEASQAAMSRAIFRFQRGEPITVGREVISGDPAGHTVHAVLKPAEGYTVPGDEVEPVATFESQFVAASGAVPAHWLLWIPAEEAEALPAGRYATDVLFLLDGEPVEVTEPAWIELSESVSG